MSIYELQKERNKQLSQPKTKEPEPVYKPLSETYNIVDYYNTMRNGKYEQMTASKAKIPNQHLSYFSEHLKSKELAKTGRHNLNLHSLLSERAQQLQGYNKPQVYEEKISSGSDSKITDELERLLNSFVDKIQSGVFDITMSNDIYRIFKIFEESSYLFSTELLEKYSEYVTDVIQVFEEDSTRELIKRDFKGSNILQLLLILTEKIKEMINIMIEANEKGTNNSEKQIILKNYIKQKNLKKVNMKYINDANEEYKRIDKRLDKARKDGDELLANTLVGKLDEIKTAIKASESRPSFIPSSAIRPMPSFLDPLYPPVDESEDPLYGTPDVASVRAPLGIDSVHTGLTPHFVKIEKDRRAIDEKASMTPADSATASGGTKLTFDYDEEAKRDDEEAKKVTALLGKKDLFQSQLKGYEDEKTRITAEQERNEEDIKELRNHNIKLTADRSELHNKKNVRKIELTKDEQEYFKNIATTMKKNTKEIERLMAQNTIIDEEITSLDTKISTSKAEIKSTETEISGMESFLRELAELAKNPEYTIDPVLEKYIISKGIDAYPPPSTTVPEPSKIPPELSEMPPELSEMPPELSEIPKDYEDKYIFTQDSSSVVRPSTGWELSDDDKDITVKIGKRNIFYPRYRQQFIKQFQNDRTSVIELLKVLKIDTRVSVMPRNSFLTVTRIYDHFLAKNTNLMTKSDPERKKRTKYWFN